jgi:glycosyltransferase involved in cell wall biosynthesis
MTMPETTISIGIPAYNEELNIKALLMALRAQVVTLGTLIEIIIVADACTDRTTKEVQSINDGRIRLVEFANRQGKFAGQNEIARRAQGDVLILLDADVVPVGPDFIDEISKPLLNDKSIGLVSPAVIAAEPKGFFERIIAQGHEMKNRIYSQINRGDNVYLCHGRARAFSRKFYRSFVWPPKYAEDAFSYLLCRQLGYRFVSNPKASVCFRCPTNFSDHRKQSLRFIQGKKSFGMYFSKGVVRDAYRIPRRIMLREFFKSLRQDAFSTLLYSLIILQISWVSVFFKTGDRAQTVFETASSSKKV